MTFWFSLLVVVALIIGLIAVFGAKEDTSDMTEEEFEAEAKRSSLVGTGMLEIQRIFQRHRVDTFVQEKQRIKQEKSFSGDDPHGPLPPLEDVSDSADDSDKKK